MKRNNKINEDINKNETKEIIQLTNMIKSWFFERVNKIDSPFAESVKRTEKPQIRKSDEKGERLQKDIIMDTLNKTYILMLWKIQNTCINF